MKLSATNFTHGSTLPLTLSGSVLLHAALLFGLPAPSSGSHATTTTILEARLVAVTPHMTTPAATVQPAPSALKDSLPIDTPRPQPDSIAPPPASETSPPAATSNAEPTYFSAAQLDTPPHLLGELQQIYPARARAAEVEGYVTLALLINERGEVEDVSVVRAQPVGYFEEAALSMLRRQRFSPPIKQNRAVKSRWLTTVRYRLQS